MDANLATLLEAVTDLVTARDPGRTAVVHGTRHRRWADLDRRASRLAGYLAAQGVSAGSRVGIGLYNSVEYFEALYAVCKLRAVPVNVNYRYREAELAGILRHTRAEALIYDSTLDERVGNVRPGLPQLRTLVSSAGFAQAVAAGPELPRTARGGSDQLIILTGGTTGRPKGVVWDHTGLYRVLSSVYSRCGLDRPADLAGLVRAAEQAIVGGTAPVMLPASPLMHGTGFFFSLGNLLLAGRIVCLTGRRLDPAEVWRAVQQHRVQELAMVGDAFGRPLVAELAAARRRGVPYDISSLRRVASSGVTWSSQVKRALLDAAASCRADPAAGGRLTLIDSVASSEGGPYGLSEVHSAGEISTRFTLPPNARVIGPDGRDVAPGSGQVGVLASTGALPLGYLDDPAATATTFRVIDGERYAVPGDAARVEPDGTVTLLGRGSGVVNTGGEKVFAEEVEQVLARHPQVGDAVVVGVPDERWGSRVAAVVEPAPGAVVDARELTAYAGRHLADYKRPRQVLVVDAIERTLAGKADRRWAQAVAAAEQEGSNRRQWRLPC